MDRFLLYVNVPYPPADNEAAILRLVRGERAGTSAKAPEPIDQEVIFAARREVAGIHVGEAAERYIVDLVIGTREPQRHGEIWQGGFALAPVRVAHLLSMPPHAPTPGCRGRTSSRRRIFAPSHRPASPTGSISVMKPKPSARRVAK